MPATRRPEFQTLFEHATAEAPYPGSEVKWQRTKRKTLATYQSLVDVFFQMPWLGFHCIVVRQGWVDLDLHRRDRDLGRRKHFTQFLANKMRSCERAHGDREVHFTVHADEPFGGSGYPKAHEAAEVVGNHILAQAGQRRSIDAVGICDSKAVAGIQLCDLLLGAVMDGWNHGSHSDPKQQLRRYIASHLGWGDLDSDTRPGERKFNVWHLVDSHSERRAPTRPVVLKYPLPSRSR